MKQRLSIALIWIATASLSQAHFSWVVPQAGAANAHLFISETLEPDPAVDVAILSGAKLAVRDAAGKETPVAIARSGDVYTVPLAGSGQRLQQGLVHGVIDLGVMTRGEAFHLLLYYPKTIVGNAFDAKAEVGKEAAVELSPRGRAGAVTLLLTARGKPQANAEVTVVLPDGQQKIVKTNDRGETEAFAALGRYGAWARFWEKQAGERGGQKYGEVRHYSMLVFDAQGEGAASETARGKAATLFAKLPQPSASLGTVVSGDWLYVYGGHVADTHVYSTASVSGRFDRLRLTGEPKWEELPGGPPLQGMNLAEHKGLIYRIGGMQPVNRPNETADNQSIAGNARFDPATKQWEDLPPLPAPRSSHDVVVIGDLLIVAAGWELDGRDGKWADTILTMDLSASKLEWKSAPQPFQRRALMAAAFEGKMYVIGGITDKDTIVNNVSIFDPKAMTWSDGPALPKGSWVAFAPAAAVHKGRLYVSVSDGTLLRLSAKGDAWETVGKGTPRVAHRLASRGDTVLSIGGAAGGKNSDLIEAIPVH